MSGAYEEDMIRPFGLMILYYCYAEYELDAFLERLATAGLLPDAWGQRPIGQKLALLADTLRTLDASIPPGLDSLLGEARELLEQNDDGTSVLKADGTPERRTEWVKASSLSPDVGKNAGRFVVHSHLLLST